MWNNRLVEFEKKLMIQLNWNIDLVTASDYLNYFIDYHFRNTLPSDFNTV